jgi:parallel beta-helix repeat protein
MATYFVNSGTVATDPTDFGSDARTPAQAQNSLTPWASLAALNTNFATFVSGDTISFKRGKKYYGTLTPNKSGVSGNPIHFNAYSTGAKPIITGFGNVTAWNAPLSSRYTSVTVLRDDPIATVVTIPNKVNMVLINGTFIPLGKFPDVGYATNSAATADTSITVSAGFPLPAGITGAGLVPEVVARKTHWVIDRANITTVAGQIINCTSPATSYNFQPSGWGVFIQHSPAVCTLQNEWWWENNGGGRIGIFSSSLPSGVQVSAVATLLDLAGFSWFTFSDIEFRGANTTVCNLAGGHDHVFTNCDFNFCGKAAFIVSFNYAVNVTLAQCTSNRVNDNVVLANTSGGWNINNSTFTDTGQVAGMGGNSNSGYNCLNNIGPGSVTGITSIRLNTIIRSGYIAIDFRGAAGNQLIQNNFIDTCCNVKDDGSGIYTYTGPTGFSRSPRPIVDGNIIINVGGAHEGTSTTNWDAHGIYMDGSASEIDITNNTVYNCGAGGIFLNDNRNITVQNNTVFNCHARNPAGSDYGQIMYRKPTADTNITTTGMIATGNIFVSKITNQRLASYLTDATDMSGWPVAPASTNWNNNRYCRPVNEDATTFHIKKAASDVITNKAGWTTASAPAGSTLDASSTTTPAAVVIAVAGNPNNIQFFYNPSINPLPVNFLTDTYMDMLGNTYTGIVNVAPWRSLIVVKTSSGGPPSLLPSSRGFIIS